MLKPRAGTEAEKSSSCLSELGIVTTSDKGRGKPIQEAVPTHVKNTYREGSHSRRGRSPRMGRRNLGVRWGNGDGRNPELKTAEKIHRLGRGEPTERMERLWERGKASE